MVAREEIWLHDYKVAASASLIIAGDTLLTEQGARESSQIRSQFGIIFEYELRLKDG